MKYFSMFSGVGGFELGIQRAFDNERTHYGKETRQTEPNQNLRQVRLRKAVSKVSRSAGRFGAANKPAVLQPRNKSTALCVGYSEIDKYAIETYEHNWKGHKNYGDATLIDERQLPDFDLLVGGFPCQAFSIAGKRHGFNETRGTLFFDIARILAHKRPRHLVLENVKGLLSHDAGKTFATIIGVLTDLGYVTEWQVLNAKDFGVPQNRERVFIVGHLGGKCRHQIFPITRDNQKATFGTIHQSYHKGQHTGSYVAETKKVKVGTLRTHKDGQGFREVKSGLAPTIPARAREDGSGQGVVAVGSQQAHATVMNNVSPALTEAMGKGGGHTPMVVRSAATRTRAYAGKPETLEVRSDEISNTINSVTKDYYATDLTRIRRLTPVECERLMSWPDNWTIGSDTQRYKQCGNGVVSNCVQAVIEALYMA